MPSLHGRLRDFLGVRAGYVPTPKPPRARAEAASQSPPPTLRDEQRPTAKPAEQPASASPRRRRPVRRSQSLARLRAARRPSPFTAMAVPQRFSRFGWAIPGGFPWWEGLRDVSRGRDTGRYDAPSALAAPRLRWSGPTLASCWTPST